VHTTDSAGRWRRWLFSGLHRLDFAEWMRERPFRDVLMWLTLLGGLGLSVTGVWLAVPASAMTSSSSGRASAGSRRRAHPARSPKGDSSLPEILMRKSLMKRLFAQRTMKFDDALSLAMYSCARSCIDSCKWGT
jgi:hypothetical protein